MREAQEENPPAAIVAEMAGPLPQEATPFMPSLHPLLRPKTFQVQVELTFPQQKIVAEMAAAAALKIISSEVLHQGEPPNNVIPLPP